ncbi:MAG: LLM class F420-dependent oxidoreductase [Chloroflexi bacterium]|nr:MAG: LLM class F420-dependent oxidoreductase [Chloroflexota bacterium]
MSATRRFKVGVTIHPQQCTIGELRDAWRRADELGVDSIWFWDHFFPLTVLAAAAVDTRAPQIGPMVTSIGYRNPDLIAYMAGTIDQLSGGRFVLGLGAGWSERDYNEFGFQFGEARDRLRTLKEALPRIQERIKKLKPGPAGAMPILIGGGGEKVTLRLVAEHAQMWNALGDPDEYARKSKILDEWCRRIGRDPREIERTANVNVRSPREVNEWLDAGLQHFVLRLAHPFDTKMLERVLEQSRG